MKKGNIIAALLIGFALIGSIATLFFMKSHTLTGNVTAIISVNGEEVKRLSLNTLTEETSFVVANKRGGENTILARPGEIAIIEANCPDQLCVERGFISSSLLPSVCLPNGVTIEIISSQPSSDTELDIIAN